MRNKVDFSKRLERNIWKNYIFSTIMYANLTSGIWMLYLAYKGLSLFEIGIMEAIFHVTSFTMEVPTGAVADLLGRKTSRILGRVMGVIGTGMMLMSQGVAGFAVSFMFSALSYNLESGAGEALVFDTMKELGTDQEYMKIKGRIEVVFHITSALSLPIGGYLATIDYRLVYQWMIVLGILSVVSALTFVEPNIGRVPIKENPMLTFVHQLRDSFKIIVSSRQLSFLIIMTESFAVFVTTTFFYIQNYMLMNGNSEFHIGIILAVGSGFSALAAATAYKFEEKFGYKKSLITLLVIGFVSLWIMSFPLLNEVGFILLSVAEAIEFVIMSDYINRMIPSERRATVLSMQSMVFSLFMILLFPLVGYVGDLYGLQRAFMMVAVIGTFISLVLIYRLHIGKAEGVQAHRTN